ncbi:MAG: c-type cytochrome, partial [Acidobacteriota bacterium]
QGQLLIAPAELATFVARGLSWSNDGGEALLATIEQGKASPLLLLDPVVSHELKFRAVDNKDQRLASLKKNLPTIDESNRALMEERKAAFASATPDPAHGREVFRKNCGACHQIAGEGAKIGPQLDGVGIRGLDRLMEDTLDPDRNVDQAFRKSIFLMDDGSVVSGLVLREEGEVIVVADVDGRERQLPADEVDERQDSTLSPMPSDVARKLPAGDFVDLMAYLLAQRTGNQTAQAPVSP